MNTFCFACKGDQCIALDNPPCASEQLQPCPFFKTQAQFDADREHAMELIAAKTDEEQSYIADKYYQGRMPWKDGDGLDR